MKVIKEVETRGPLKGIIFYNNNVSSEREIEVRSLVSKTYDSWNKTNRLNKDDLINLKNDAEISTARIAGNAIKLSNGIELDITNKINEEETEWNMFYTLIIQGKVVFEINDFDKILDYKYQKRSILDWITKSDKVELYTLYT